MYSKTKCTVKLNVILPVNTLTLSETSITNLDVGKSKTLTAKITPSSAEKITSITWKSSNTNVASVSTKGVVKGEGPGTAKITVTATSKDGTSKKATCKVTVKDNIGTKLYNVVGQTTLV